MAKTDEGEVERARELLETLGCPDPQRGEGSPLFPQRDDGTSPPTPDLVAGPFLGAEHPGSFFIDVVAPSGDYIFNERAGAAPSARFFGDVVDKRSEFTPDDVPRDFAKPLVIPIIRKSDKYSKGRSKSPLFGVVAYFDQLAKNGGSLISSLFYMRALHETLGGVAFSEIERGHAQTPADLNSRVGCEVDWDLPLAFLLQLVISGNTGETARLEVTMLVNRHERVNAVSSNPVVAWARSFVPRP
jgi:hypothetical protein